MTDSSSEPGAGDARIELVEYAPEGDVNVSVRPESISEVDEVTRDRWVVEAAERTLERIRRFTDADPEDPDIDEYIAMAHEEYGDDVEPYRQSVVGALESMEDAAEASAD